MNQIIVMIGISGSGKSTKARQIREELTTQGKRALIVSKDKIRELLFGYTEDTIQDYYRLPNLFILEKQVAKYQESLIDLALAESNIVILDNTHVKLSYINEIRNKYIACLITYELVECNLNEAIIRDLGRTRRVTEEVIKKQFNNLNILKRNFDFKATVPKGYKILKQDPNLPKAYVFDIDGTLALMQDRGPFEWSKVGQDLVNEPVAEILQLLREQKYYQIIICSGRDEVCRDETVDWLIGRGIYYDELHMRSKNDCRKDNIVKEEFWRDLVRRYNIVAMYDDRDQVVKHARNLGFKVFQVADGNF